MDTKKLQAKIDELKDKGKDENESVYEFISHALDALAEADSEFLKDFCMFLLGQNFKLEERVETLELEVEVTNKLVDVMQKKCDLLEQERDLLYKEVFPGD